MGDCWGRAERRRPQRQNLRRYGGGGSRDVRRRPHDPRGGPGPEHKTLVPKLGPLKGGPGLGIGSGG